MSGLAGIWNFDGEPVSQPILAAMNAQLAHRGPDGSNRLIDGANGFACQALRNTPESKVETQPTCDFRGNILVWDGRLDNRADLAEVLGAERPAPAAPDTDFVLAAYRVFGEAFAAKLNGDFALALFDPKPQRLLLARDVMGLRTLHYCCSGQSFLFASEVKALLAHPGVEARPDDRSLAEWFYRIPDYSDLTNTFFANICRVPPGHQVTVTPQRVTVSRYWDFDPHRKLELRDYGEYVAAYKETFQRAVTARMRSTGPVAVSVSGGLDSSSIFSVAQQASRDGAPPVCGIAFVGDAGDMNDSEYQDALEHEFASPLTRIPFRSTNTKTENVSDLSAWSSEGPYLKWEIWRSYYREATRQGCRNALSGEFGDQLLINPQYLLDLVQQGRLTAAYRHLRRFYGWWDDRTAWDQTLDLYAGLKGYLIPERLRPLYHRVRRHVRGDLVEYIPWFSPRFVALASELERQKTPMPVEPGRAHAKVLYQHAHAKIPSLRLDLELKADARFACIPSFPFRDRDLIALLMAMPGEVVYHSGYRGIHRDAMKGILPEKIRSRRNKAPFQRAARDGALHDLAISANRLPSGAAARMGYLCDSQDFSNCLQDLEATLTRSHGSRPTWLALDLIGLEDWLSAFFC